MSVEAMHAFQLKMMGVNLEKLSALSTICLFCAYFWNSFMWVGRDTCSTVFLDLLCTGILMRLFFSFAAHKIRMVSALSHICMLWEGLSFLFEDYALFFFWFRKFINALGKL